MSDDGSSCKVPPRHTSILGDIISKIRNGKGVRTHIVFLGKVQSGLTPPPTC